MFDKKDDGVLVSDCKRSEDGNTVVCKARLEKEDGTILKSEKDIIYRIIGNTSGKGVTYDLIDEGGAPEELLHRVERHLMRGNLGV